MDRKTPVTIKDIPKSITILGREYTIEMKTRDQLCELSKVEGAVASVENGTQTILLWDEDTDYFGTLVHEIMHVVQYVTGIDQIICPQIQEILCESTSNGVKDLIKSLHPPKKSTKRKK